MGTAFRVAALFTVYSAIGYGGDYAAALAAQAVGDDDMVVRVDASADPEVDVVVEVLPEVRVRLGQGSECTYRELRELRLDGDVTSLSIDAGSGSLTVEGRSGIEQIVVEAMACASREAWLDELRVTAEAVDGRATIETHYPDARDRVRGDNTARLDLTVLVPEGLAVDIDDSSGEIDVRDTGSLRISDSSGSIRVQGVQGSVWIDDSSGDVEVMGVSGDVEVEDGSGGIDVTDVGGVVALRDGSGGIRVSDVDRDVIIESDGSGSIDVDRVVGDFVVERDGSGSIRHSDVGGRVQIPQDQRRRRRRGGR